MKFKLDENIAGIKLIVRGINSDFDVETVQSEKIRGTPDNKLLDILLKEQRILITTDRDFENLLLHPPGSHYGIIILRSRKQGKSILSDLITDFFEDLNNQDYSPKYLIKERIIVQRLGTSKVIIESLE